MFSRHTYLRHVATILLLALLACGQAVAQTSNMGNDIHEIRGLIYPVSWWDWGKWIVLLCVIFTVMGLLIYWWTRRKNSIRAKTMEQAAYDRLRAAHGFIDQGKAREFSIEASETIREYVEKRFSQHATHQTTEEFLHVVATQSSRLQWAAIFLNDFLQYCDLAKFAKTQLTTEQMEGMYTTAWQFISNCTRTDASLQGDRDK